MSIGVDGLTDAQRRKLWAEEEAKAEAKCADRQASEHHTRCRDCGQFVSKRRWVKIDRFNHIRHQQRPLCASCFDEYD